MDSSTEPPCGAGQSVQAAARRRQTGQTATSSSTIHPASMARRPAAVGDNAIEARPPHASHSCHHAGTAPALFPRSLRIVSALSLVNMSTPFFCIRLDNYYYIRSVMLRKCDTPNGYNHSWETSRPNTPPLDLTTSSRRNRST